MILMPLEIKISVTFGSIDLNSNSVVKKDSFTIDLQKLDRELFLEAFDSLVKIKEELINQK
jgi:hypothetical protein